MLDFLKGKKTYLAAVGFGILALVSLSNGDMLQAGQYFSAALAAVGLRSAIDNQGGK